MPSGLLSAEPATCWPRSPLARTERNDGGRFPGVARASRTSARPVSPDLRTRGRRDARVVAWCGEARHPSERRSAAVHRVRLLRHYPWPAGMEIRRITALKRCYRMHRAEGFIQYLSLDRKSVV